MGLKLLYWGFGWFGKCSFKSVRIELKPYFFFSENQ